MTEQTLGAWLTECADRSLHAHRIKIAYHEKEIKRIEADKEGYKKK